MAPYTVPGYTVGGWHRIRCRVYGVRDDTVHGARVYGVRGATVYGARVYGVRGDTVYGAGVYGVRVTPYGAGYTASGKKTYTMPGYTVAG